MEDIKELRALRAEQVENAEKAIAEEKPDEAKSALEQIKELDERIAKVEAEVKELKGDDKGDEGDKPADKVEGEQRSMDKVIKPSINNEQESKEVRGFMKYLRSKGEIREDVTSVNMDIIIPKDISTQPVTLPETVIDLKQFTNIVKVPTAQGSYPVLESATETMHTVEELAKNPELAAPKFNDVDYKVQTYRGQIAISEESLQDSTPDLAGLVAQNNARIGLNTTNKAISDVFKTFTAKTVDGTDALKTILNVDFDPAYNVSLVVSSTFYNELDKLKDKNGQYILQQDITSPSGRTIFGRPVYVVSDTSFGETGEAKAFIGDIKEAVLFADRAQAAVRWIDNEIYGQLLAISQRFDVVKANEKAGFFVTGSFTESAPTESTPEGA